MEERVSTSGCIHSEALSGDALEYRTRAAVTKILSLCHMFNIFTRFSLKFIYQARVEGEQTKISVDSG